MRGTVSAGDRLTAQAGAEMLRRGGNAFDAAVAAMLAAPMSEPILTSMGGGGFMLAYEAGVRPVLYDFFVDVPPNRAKKPDFGPIEVDFGTTVQEFHIGTASIAVPGMIAGIDQIHKDLCSLPIEVLIEPAYRYASDGVRLNTLQADFVKLLEPILLSTDASSKLFAPDDKLIAAGENWTNPEYADFLKFFAQEGAKPFYRGEIADRIDRLSLEGHGNIRKSDLKSYKVLKRDPIIFDYHDKQIATNPPPSAGGILIAFALELLASKHHDSFESLDYVRDLIEAIATTSQFRSEHIDKDLHDNNLSTILQDPALLSHYLSIHQKRINKWGNTTHISIIDEQGNAASVTSTNGEGSGRILPGTGIMLNNMLGEEDLNPHGFFKWPSGVRLPSMMAPTMVFEGGDVDLVLGSAGSNRIRSAIAEVIERYVTFGEDIKASIDAPRIHSERGEVFFEHGFAESIIDEVSRYYRTTVFEDFNLFFGGVNAVTGDFHGGADPRRGGAVEIVDSR